MRHTKLNGNLTALDYGKTEQKWSGESREVGG